MPSSVERFRRVWMRNARRASLSNIPGHIGRSIFYSYARHWIGRVVVNCDVGGWRGDHRKTRL